jgi:hypothetical protein
MKNKETLEESLNDEQTANSIKADAIRCQSLTYFAENYLPIKDKDSNERKLNDASMEMLKMIEEAHKKECSLKLMWMRNKYVWMMVKD